MRTEQCAWQEKNKYFIESLNETKESNLRDITFSAVVQAFLSERQKKASVCEREGGEICEPYFTLVMNPSGSPNGNASVCNVHFSSSSVFPRDFCSSSLENTVIHSDRSWHTCF